MHHTDTFHTDVTDAGKKTGISLK